MAGATIPAGANASATVPCRFGLLFVGDYNTGGYILYVIRNGSAVVLSSVYSLENNYTCSSNGNNITVTRVGGDNANPAYIKVLSALS